LKVLITGGAGYIGSALATAIYDHSNYDVEIFDNFPQGSIYVNRFLSSRRFEFTRADIRDEAKIKSSIKSADVIVHLAGVVGFPACDANPAEARSVNEDGTQVITSNVAKGQRLIFASTGSVYGVVEGTCDESNEPSPLSLYGKTKVVGEQMVQDIGGVSLRLATLCGVANKMRDDLLIHTLCKSAVEENYIALFQGSAMRTFLDVTDAARCFLLACDQDFPEGECFNVGSDSLNFSKRQIAKLVVEKTGAKLFESDFSADRDGRDYSVSYQKIRDVGFTAHENIDSIIEKVISYYDLNRNFKS
jgi:nucleoside-diphosphate-sugar epimerase